ncbi:MAG: GSCFA domain-containing protein [Bacteroidales bacterium]|nr:GSCFA domain-containing protein [Bacteroidales bacterium]
MKFRTEIDIPEQGFRIGYHQHIMMMGSCFTDNIGELLRKYLFHINVNPFGVTYNPASIARGLEILLKKDRYEAEELRIFNELYFSFDHYTKFSGTDRDRVLNTINDSLLAAGADLKKTGPLILTLGSAYVYIFKETREVVNNCHKLPADRFDRELLSVEGIANRLGNVIDQLKLMNDQMKVILTVSPVRHIRDSLIENQRSKSILLLAAKELVNSYPGTCSYFPAYEIMMDDLRDYRYYASDLLHPNDQAIQYIWEHFKNTYLDPESLKIMDQLNPLLRSVSHRPLHPGTPSHRKFISAMEEKKEKLRNYFSFLNWSELND